MFIVWCFSTLQKLEPFRGDKFDNFNKTDKNNLKKSMIIEYSGYPFTNFRYSTDSFHRWLPILSSFHLNWSDQTRWSVDILLKYRHNNEFSQANRRSLRRRANARNVSFRISLRWLTYIVNSVDKTKLSCNTPTAAPQFL